MYRDIKVLILVTGPIILISLFFSILLTIGGLLENNLFAFEEGIGWSFLSIVFIIIFISYYNAFNKINKELLC